MTKWVFAFKKSKSMFENKKNLADVIEQIKLDSRRYAKRQYTFFKHQFDTKWFNVNFNDFQETINEVYKYIED